MTKVGTAVVIDLLKMAQVEEIAVAGGAVVVYSQVVGLPRNATFCANIKASSGGVIELVVELESANELPGTEEAADGNYVIPDGKSEVIAALGDALVHRAPYAPAATKFCRFKISGTGSNAATTKINRLQLSYILAR